MRLRKCAKCGRERSELGMAYGSNNQWFCTYEDENGETHVGCGDQRAEPAQAS